MPILIGVIVLGFVIGAGLSLSGRHDTVVAVASPSPASHETFVPVTPAPTEKPTSQPTAAPTTPERASNAKTIPATAIPATAVPATAIPAPEKAATLKLATAAPASQRLAVAPTSPPAASEDETAAPRARVEPRVTAMPTEDEATSKALAATRAPILPAPAGTEPAPIATAQGDAAFARLSAAVVRQYLESVKRGDQASAFAVLASPPGSEQELAEYGVVDARTSVGRIDAHGAANDNAFVSVQMDTPSGPYFGQYTVHKSDSGAAVIVAHTIVKP